MTEKNIDNNISFLKEDGDNMDGKFIDKDVTDQDKVMTDKQEMGKTAENERDTKDNSQNKKPNRTTRRIVMKESTGEKKRTTLRIVERESGTERVPIPFDTVINDPWENAFKALTGYPKKASKEGGENEKDE